MIGPIMKTESVTWVQQMDGSWILWAYWRRPGGPRQHTRIMIE